jgi:hypothetical protein
VKGERLFKKKRKEENFTKDKIVLDGKKITIIS